MKLVQKLMHHGDEKLVLGGFRVEGAKVDAEPQDLSALRTRRTRVENGDMLGRMMP